MAVPRVPRDYQNLIERHQNLLIRLNQVAQMKSFNEKQIREAAGTVKEEEMEKILSGIPVETLTREKKGVRVTTLRSSGFENLLKIRKADFKTLEAINGISAEAAGEIQQIAEKLASQAESGIRIRLNRDRKTPASENLVNTIFQYEKNRKLSETCGRLIQLNQAPVSAAVQDLKIAESSFKWLFYSREKKEKALAAYDFLHGLLTSGYEAQAENIFSQVDANLSLTREDAWVDFENRSISYYNILEKFCPELVGGEDPIYGLPQELAEQVNKEQYSLEGLSCQLRSYQKWGVGYILHQGNVLLGDEMGLGKTVQAIAAMVALRNQGEHHFLVICPASVMENWCREIRKHSDLHPVLVHGDDREEALQRWMREGGTAVTNYETTGLFNLPQDFFIAMVVVDEAHYIKNPQARRTKNVKAICSHGGRKLFMTGTALENRVDEMVNLLEMLQPEAAGKAERMASLATAPQFREAIASCYYRRKREDVLTELPDLIEKMEWCRLGRQEERTYEQAVMEGKFTQARRVSWTAPAGAESCKMTRLLEILEDAREDGRKVIVFSFFLDTIQKIRMRVGENCLEPINGSVPVDRRQEIIDEFEKAPAGTVLAAQIQAGGTGLNIQCASVVILCEPQLKPSIENQAISRAYRMGQTRNVLVYRLVCEDTVDERILEMLESKQQEFDSFADDSAAAEQTMEADSSTLSRIFAEEEKRIEEKYGLYEAASSGWFEGTLCSLTTGKKDGKNVDLLVAEDGKAVMPSGFSQIQAGVYGKYLTEEQAEEILNDFRVQKLIKLQGTKEKSDL